MRGTDRRGQLPVLRTKMDDATAPSALAGYTAKLKSIAEPMRASLTCDQGEAMSRHAELAAQTGVKACFCDSHNRWRRGTCENTEGLRRQYLPKGTDLSACSRDELEAIADSLNGRPRATYTLHSPLPIFAIMVSLADQPATPIH